MGSSLISGCSRYLYSVEVILLLDKKMNSALKLKGERNMKMKTVLHRTETPELKERCEKEGKDGNSAHIL